MEQEVALEIPGPSKDSQMQCDSCSISHSNGVFYKIRGRSWFKRKCLRCSLLDKALFQRSFFIAVSVGTFLISVNHGSQILHSTYSWSSDWYKILFSYLVPFLVSTYGALSNSRQA